MDILLTHGYFLYEDPKELQIMKPYPPLGILYICAHLRSKGLSVEVFDSTFSSRQQLFDLLRQGPPSVLGIYANLMTRSNVIEILRVAKDAGWKTLVGGPEPVSYTHLDVYKRQSEYFIMISVRPSHHHRILSGAIRSTSSRVCSSRRKKLLS